jgi:parallel beta-helix repeat protein
MLSLYPALEVTEVTDLLQQSADPVIPEICASGRLNLYEALQAVSLEAGSIILDRDFYSCCDAVEITVRDLDLTGSGSQEVTIESDSSDLETVDLMETSPLSGLFTGTILTDSGSPDIGDNILQVSHDEIITATYYDANDVTGNPAIVTNTAAIDCQAPIISNVQFDEYPQGPQLMITFETDEPTTACLLCGLTRKRLYTAKYDDTLATYHTIQLDDDIMQPDCTYYFVIEVNDIVGNNTTDDNNRKCYTFTTAGPRDIYVPDEYATIQEAIDGAWQGSTIWVADGIYTGQGNKNIDFKGKLLTLRSESGPEACIIDCENNGRGFYFHSGETADSRLEGFTICNGGTGIWCDGSSPTITNCILTDNSGRYDGGIFCDNNSNPVISDCAFIGNYGLFSSGVRCHHNSSPTITNCIFTACSDGAAIFCEYRSNSNPAISNCRFYANHLACAITVQGGCDGTVISNCIISGNDSIGIICSGSRTTPSNPTITNCDIIGNLGKGIYCEESSSPKITNCIVWANAQQVYGGNPSVSYCNIQGGWPGEGNIDTDPCFVDLQNDDYHLLPGSPCIDTGDPNYAAEPDETDLDGNSRIVNDIIDIGAYEVQLPDPVELLLYLVDQINGLNLQHGIANSLQSKLDTVLRLLEDGSENNDVASVNILQAFINALEAQRGGKIPQIDADALIAAAQEIIELLSN